MMSTPGLRVTHVLPGRIRVKVDALRGNPTLADELARAVHGLDGVRTVETSTTTGSLLVYHDAHQSGSPDARDGLARTLARWVPNLDAPAVASHLASHARPRHVQRAPHGEHVRRAFQDLNQRVVETTGGIDLTLVVPLVLVGLGVRGWLAAGETLVPRWYDFLWFGFATFMLLNAAGVPTARAAEEAVELAAEI